MLADIAEYLIAVFFAWKVWILDGLMGVLVEVLDRYFEWKLPRRVWIWAFVVLGFFIASFGAWREERDKVRAQMAYMWIRTNESWIPNHPEEQAGRRAWVNFGVENATQYPATEETTAKELIVLPLPHPMGEITPETNPSTPELEMSAWNQMLSDQENEKHITTTYDPGEKYWKSAFTKETLSNQQIDSIAFQKTAIIYLVGIEKWESAGGVHAKTFCYWLHPAYGKVPVVADKCKTHNDYLDKAEPYLKYTR
jgi:hypothetical protein